MQWSGIMILLVQLRGHLLLATFACHHSQGEAGGLGLGLVCVVQRVQMGQIELRGELLPGADCLVLHWMDQNQSWAVLTSVGQLSFHFLHETLMDPGQLLLQRTEQTGEDACWG